jgi:GDP-L-fucose synthase
MNLPLNVVENFEAQFANSKVYVAGHRGMVGSAICRQLEKTSANLVCRTRNELDLCNQAEVRSFFETERPNLVFLAAAKVGGIHANETYPAEFLYDNLMMASNVIEAAHQTKTKRLLFLGSTCIYPKMASQPLEEDSLLSGPLEATNEAYAIAKIAGLKLCQFYRQQYGDLFHSAMPTNLYGPEDNYHPENSHVLPALLQRIHTATLEQAPNVKIWGSGSPRREFLYVDDLAEACLHLVTLENPPQIVNVGTGVDLTIKELATKIAAAVGYNGEFEFDSSKPDGTPVKRTDTTRLQSTGWKSSTTLDDGLKKTFNIYLADAEANALRAR